LAQLEPAATASQRRSLSRRKSASAQTPRKIQILAFKRPKEIARLPIRFVSARRDQVASFRAIVLDSIQRKIIALVDKVYPHDDKYKHVIRREMLSLELRPIRYRTMNGLEAFAAFDQFAAGEDVDRAAGNSSQCDD
jgi:hypothetical protein